MKADTKANNHIDILFHFLFSPINILSIFAGHINNPITKT